MTMMAWWQGWCWGVLSGGIGVPLLAFFIMFFGLWYVDWKRAKYRKKNYPKRYEDSHFTGMGPPKT